MEILKQRIKQLRVEKEWSQERLAKEIGVDARTISRYETGKIIPSVEAVVKLAITFNVAADFLIMENACKQPVRMEDKELLKQINNLQMLSLTDRKSIFHIIETLAAKNKIKSVVQDID